MAPLTADRNTPASLGNNRVGGVGAASRIFAGALLMRNAAGFLVAGQVATGLIGVGRAGEQVDNSAGADGALAVKYEPGIFLYANSAGGDAITIAHIGDLAYAVDDQTVALTHAVNTRSAAGIVDDVDEFGVWVRFDEALTKAV